MIEFMRKIEGSFKDTVISLFKTNTTKQTVYGRGEKLNKLKTQKLSDGKNKSIRNLFTLKKKKEINDRTLFEEEVDNYYKPKKSVISRLI